MAKKSKLLSLVLMTIIMSIFITSISFGNSAEPPSIVIIFVANTLSLIAGGYIITLLPL